MPMVPFPQQMRYPGFHPLYQGQPAMPVMPGPYSMPVPPQSHLESLLGSTDCLIFLALETTHDTKAFSYNYRQHFSGEPQCEALLDMVRKTFTLS